MAITGARKETTAQAAVEAAKAVVFENFEMEVMDIILTKYYNINDTEGRIAIYKHWDHSRTRSM